MRCKYWIFDMDGTLTDSMVAVWRNAPMALLKRFGKTPEPELHDILLPLGLRESAEYLISHYQLPLDEPGYVSALHETVSQLYETVELKPGVRELLEHLHAAGARCCICSNTWEAQCRTVLTRLGIADRFEFYITAQGEKSKHHPAVFFEALHRLGGEDPAACAVCEDAVYSARTAHAAGFHLLTIADFCSKDDEPELRRISDQFVTDWRQLDWNRI